MIPILAAAILAAYPLPPGNGLDRSVPLTVAGPAGAAVGAKYRDHKGVERIEECMAPCAVHIPRGSPFLLHVAKDGRRYPVEPVRWVGKGVFGARLELEPSTVLEGAQ